MKALTILWVLCFAIFFSGANSTKITFNVGKQAYYRKPEFGYLNFLFHPNSTLEVDDTRQFHAQNYKQCLLACASNLTCLSINFGKKPIFFYQGKAQYLCEMLPTDKYNSSSKFQSPNSDFNHYSIRSECSKSPCLHNFTCIPNYDNDTYECLCPRPPYEDVDECTTGQHDCSGNANCTNTIGSFNCTCKDGYVGNGRNCTEITIALESDMLRDYGNYSYHAALKTFMDEVPEDVVNTRWTRCWSGKNDGFDVTRTFHPQCDGKGATVTLVRKNQYIWGGYTDVPWSSPSTNTFYNSTKSFIFTLFNIRGFNPQKFNIIKTNIAVYHHHHNYGPAFGGLKDLKIHTHASTMKYNINKPYAYAIPPGCAYNQYCNFFTGIEDLYTIDDIEVFYKNTM
ncbi:uncharacterized protein LOC116290032 isoform X2 [Actinia tenebrosa]|uniref:Uncharacterized protein LOC116290032 isoform X2 n=1 Tax=Actinia tenebrosa TaxID=6105 RepID=A0A6P8HJV9_ACTTE|nr:uncharacterized protein LOC116290032 isoform X2 [Actinia tenebrosa]